MPRSLIDLARPANGRDSSVYFTHLPILKLMRIVHMAT